ncbi:tetratricopeptide repeat-containing sulfotransferase family protein [Alteromonas confluentis]|uniref:Uncharacterized protein n=1 Tax=Alteromonas confluentis TaxID=1656094 RepID=A0A1E7Z6G5_9ALTE|nr:sulfotransferase [Alteromonas confluentis]OFC69125.1 hypothetical protein BFC18_20555 [Alteromonas confluentis]
MNQSETHARIEQYIAQRNFDAAAADCIQLVKTHADDARGWQLLSEVSLRLKQNRMAVNAALKAVDLVPENPTYLLHLAKVYAGFSAWNATRKVLNRLDALTSIMTVSDLAALALLYFQGLDYAKAENVYRQLLSVDSDNVEAKYNLAAILRYTGKLDEAAALLRAVLNGNPASVEACSALAHVKKHRADDDTLARIDACLSTHSRDATSSDMVLASLQYARGKVLEEQGDFASAFEVFSLGAAAKKAQQTFTTEHEIARIRAMQSLVSNNAFPALTQSDEPGPVFIVGMPRTGTTLVERILTTHSAVTSGGELNFMPMTLLEASGKSWFEGPEGVTAEALKKISGVNFNAIGERYMALSRDLLACTGIFTDKLPLNALFVPVILAAIPNARIIQVTRNTMDTAFSNFKMLFTRGYDYSYSLDDIAAYMPAYQQMMNQWQQTYGERVHTVNYETLVAQPENTVRSMLDFCNLSWEPACLAFHNQAGATQTASASQIKEPLHSRYVGQWKHYEDALLSLKKQLEKEGVTPLTEEDIKW